MHAGFKRDITPTFSSSKRASFFFCRNTETNDFKCWASVAFKDLNKALDLLQSQQAFTTLAAGTEVWCEKRSRFFKDGGECRRTRGSKRCFIVGLTFKSSQGSRAEALKNNQFPSLLMTLLTLDHYRRSTLRQPSVHDLHRASTMHRQSGFAQHEHTLELCVNAILSLRRKNKSSHSL